MDSTKEKELEIRDLKAKRSDQWKMKKSDRDYKEIENINNKINQLKKELTEVYDENK